MKHAASVYVWAALALCALGLPGAIAEPTSAQAAPAPTFHWCPGQSVGPGLGQHLRLGLEPLPRLGTRGRPGWRDGQRAVGSATDLGAAAATATAVGSGRTGDVEYDRARLGILEQQRLDADLNLS